MADLDDFFAKKDKKKSKGKKFTTVDQVAKKLEDTSKKPIDVKVKKDKEKLGQDGENISSNLQYQEDDEWKEFEEEKKDYSGLKIQNMQLNENEERGEGQGEEGDSDDGEGGEGGGRRAAGPWKMPVTQEANENDSDEDEPPPEPVPKRPEVKEASSYVPPHLRNAAASAGSGPTQHSRLKSKTAPDINNEAYFPTLSAAAASEPLGPWGKKGRNPYDDRGFEEVRNSKSHTSRMDSGRQGGTSGAPGRVTVENKFDALRHSDQS